MSFVYGSLVFLSLKCQNTEKKKKKVVESLMAGQNFFMVGTRD